MEATDELTLTDRIQGLAQELQDMILDFTIAIAPSTVHVTPAYKKPWQLNINRATRKAVAEAYYQGCTFVWRSDTRREVYVRWLKSLPAAHHAMIHKIRLWNRDRDEVLLRPTMVTESNRDLLNKCLWVAAQAGNMLSVEVFWTNINLLDERGNERKIWVQPNTLCEMWKDPSWTAREWIVYSWEQPPEGCTWDSSE